MNGMEGELPDCFLQIQSNLYTLYSNPQLLTDDSGWIIAALVGHPSGRTDWMKTLNEVFQVCNQANRNLKYPRGCTSLPRHSNSAKNRRGSYQTVAYGISHGGGQLVSRSMNICIPFH